MTLDNMASNLSAIMPINIVVAWACVLLLVDLFIPKERKGWTALLAALGLVLAMGFARITKPVCMGLPTHKHPFDQWIYLIGDTKNFADFDADIEMTLGDKIVKINYPCYVFIPKNVMHCPLDVKRVGKPFIFIDARVTEEASVRPAKIVKKAPVQYLTKQQLATKKTAAKKSGAKKPGARKS